MGLDISYYKNARAITDEERAALEQIPENHRYDWTEERGIERLYRNPGFPGRDEGLPSDDWVTAEAVGTFCAGSYGGYGDWRRNLASLVGIDNLRAWWDAPQPGPFAELLNFADNEGVIGPVVSAKLAKDFAEWRARASEFASTLPDDDGEWFMRKYKDWQAAFTAAQQGGYVDFH